MKKLLALLLAPVVIFMMAACGSRSPETVQLGIAAAEGDNRWSAAVAHYAEMYCRDNDIAWQINFSSDPAEMARNLKKLVDGGCNVIVSCPRWSGMESALQKIVEQGIPVVNMDADVACKGIYKVTGDNYDMGYRCAEHITGVAGDGAHIVVMDVPTSGSVCQLRKDGFYDYLEEIGYDTSNVLEYQLEAFSYEDGRAAMTEILSGNPQIDAIFSMDDEISMGAVRAIRDAGRTDIRAITGGGGCQEYLRMIADEQYADLGLSTALYGPDMVIEAIKAAVALGNGGEAERLVIIPTAIVTADNVSNYLDSGDSIY